MTTNIKLVIPPKYEQTLTGRTMSFVGWYNKGTYKIDIYKSPFDIKSTKNGKRVSYYDVPKTLRQVQQNYVASENDLMARTVNVA